MAELSDNSAFKNISKAAAAMLIPTLLAAGMPSKASAQAIQDNLHQSIPAKEIRVDARGNVIKDTIAEEVSSGFALGQYANTTEESAKGFSLSPYKIAGTNFRLKATNIATVVSEGPAYESTGTTSNLPQFQEKVAKPGKEKKKGISPVIIVLGALAVGTIVYFATKKKKDDPTPPPVTNNKATVTVLGYDGQPLTSGQVTTDVGTYPVGTDGTVNLEYKTSLDAKIASSGFIQRNTRIENAKKYRMIPSEWDAFYSDPGVAGPTKGTNRFDGSVKFYIDGSTTDSDYAKAQARIAVVCGSTVPYSIVTDAAQANFTIKLNYSENLHGETVSGKGMITDTDVYLVDNVDNGTIDTELGQGLTHIGGVKTGPPIAGPSAIVGSVSGWYEPTDRKILDTIYNRSKSTFNSTGSEKENF